MADLFFTSDQHFMHEAALKHSKRPFSSMDEMNETIVDRWNATVKRGDTVILAGDFAWRDHAKWLNRLNGSKRLVKGNHDKMPQSVLRLFASVDQILQMNQKPYHIIVYHYPLHEWNMSHYGSWHLHGHCHGYMVEWEEKLRFDIGVDVWDFAPVPWEVVVAKMKYKEAVQIRWRKNHPPFDDGDKYRNMAKLTEANRAFRTGEVPKW